MLARTKGAIIARLRWKPASAFAWAVLLALLVLPFSMRPTSAATPPHIAFIAMENTGYNSLVGNSSMPFTQTLIANNGIASITDTCHPSLPNYLSITDGSIHGCPQDTAPSAATYPGPTFYDELAGAGISWKAYVDGAAGNCDINSGFSNFDVNHVPQAYYTSIRNSPAQCNQIQPLTQLTSDLKAGTAPSFVWITPNLINDMHDGTPAQGDAYLNSQVTQLRNSSWFTPGSRIVIWWDEDEGTSHEQILLISVGSSHSTTIGAADHYGVLRGLEEAYGVGLLGSSASSTGPDKGSGTVGDILPLLTGSAPPPAPSPSPSPTPTPTPTATSPSATAGPSSVTRGIVRFTSTDWAAMHEAGFNAATDGGVQDSGAAQAGAGLTGMVWVNAYDNTTCTQTMTNASIQTMVQANVSAGYTGLRYMVGDEPTANGCNAAAAYTSMTAAVHAVDPTAKTWVFDDQFQVGNPVLPNIPMAGSVDILAFDVYPCQSGPCDFGAIDSAVQQIHAAGLKNWEFGIQDFSASPWRWPTPSEIEEQFAHWQNAGAIGYWVFAWDYLGGQVINQSGNVAALQAINAAPINGAAAPASWTSLGGLLTSAPAAAASGATRSDVFVRGSDNALYQKTWNGTSWGSWIDLGGTLTSSPSAASWGTNRIDVFVRGSDNALYHRSWDGTSWSSWESLGGYLTSGPGAATWGSGHLDVYVRGSDNALYQKTWNGTSWSSWMYLGGILTSDPSAVSWGTNRIDVFVRGTDNALWQRSWDGTRWSNWQSLGGWLSMGVASASCASGHLDVFVAGSDDALYQISFNGTWGSWLRLGGTATSTPGATCQVATGVDSVFVRGADFGLWQHELPGT